MSAVAASSPPPPPPSPLLLASLTHCCHRGRVCRGIATAQRPRGSRPTAGAAARRHHRLRRCGAGTGAGHVHAASAADCTRALRASATTAAAAPRARCYSSLPRLLAVLASCQLSAVAHCRRRGTYAASAAGRRRPQATPERACTPPRRPVARVYAAPPPQRAILHGSRHPAHATRRGSKPPPPDRQW